MKDYLFFILGLPHMLAIRSSYSMVAYYFISQCSNVITISGSLMYLDKEGFEQNGASHLPWWLFLLKVVVVFTQSTWRKMERRWRKRTKIQRTNFAAEETETSGSNWKVPAWSYSTFATEESRRFAYCKCSYIYNACIIMRVRNRFHSRLVSVKKTNIAIP